MSHLPSASDISQSSTALRYTGAGADDRVQDLGVKNALHSVLRGLGLTGKKVEHGCKYSGLAAFDQSIRPPVQ